MQKYKILIDGASIKEGYFANADYKLLENLVDFLRTRVRDGVIVELITWNPNR
jgi:hypothetical protein